MSHRLIVAGVILAIAVTPTVLDSVMVWNSHPDLRWIIFASYAFAAYVAWNAYQMFDGNGSDQEETYA